MKKLKEKVVIAFITAGGSILAAFFAGFNGGRSYEKQDINNTITNEIGSPVVNVFTEEGFANAYIDLNDKYEQLLEKNTTLQSNYDFMNSDYEELKQSSEYLAELEATNSKLKSDLEQSESELTKLKENNSVLTIQMSNMSSVEFVNSSIYVDGGELLNLNNPVLLINVVPYYSENALKMILRNLGKEYEHTVEEINIGKKSETEKLPLSQAKIYDLGSYSSQSSGIRSDLSDNEFSGLLLKPFGDISYFIDKKYSKMCGTIHITKETGNSNSGAINISTLNEDGNETVVYTSERLNNLSDVVHFSDVPINDAKVVIIYVSGYIKAVISEAYFYN